MKFEVNFLINKVDSPQSTVYGKENTSSTAFKAALSVDYGLWTVDFRTLPFNRHNLILCHVSRKVFVAFFLNHCYASRTI